MRLMLVSENLKVLAAPVQEEGTVDFPLWAVELNLPFVYYSLKENLER